jgi:DNA polymerase III sliding clamp (beta) subunit (PCNA family)
MTQKDLNKLHSTKRAIPNKVYVDEFGKTYIGTKDGRLEKISSDIDISKVKSIAKEVIEATNSSSSTTTVTTTQQTNSYFPSGW